MANFKPLTPDKSEVRTYTTLFLNVGEDVVAARLYVNGELYSGRLIPAGRFFRLFPDVAPGFSKTNKELYLTEITELFGEFLAEQLFIKINEGGIINE